jgi:radical SAM-linked protein
LNDVKEFLTVRVTFQKTGAARYISHLDLNRTMIRALRRAELPIWYTEGFNKHPYVTFAAPLSLGYEGERETMDVRLNQELPMDEVVHRLDAVMPAGLRIVGAAPAVKKAGEVDSAVYRLTVGCPLPVIREFLEQPVITVQKRTKKKTVKDIDLRPVLDGSQSEFSQQDGKTVWQLTLPCNSTDSVNPSLIADALRRYRGQEEMFFFVRRLAVLDKEGQVFA